MVVERVNATHMEVRWTALSPVEARGHITHYTISYWPASNSEPVTSITVHNTTSTSYRVLIGGLLSGEAYVVEVSASTAAGDGDKAEVTLEKGECCTVYGSTDIAMGISTSYHTKFQLSLSSY